MEDFDGIDILHIGFITLTVLALAFCVYQSRDAIDPAGTFNQNTITAAEYCHTKRALLGQMDYKDNKILYDCIIPSPLTIIKNEVPR